VRHSPQLKPQFDAMREPAGSAGGCLRTDSRMGRLDMWGNHMRSETSLRRKHFRRSAIAAVCAGVVGASVISDPASATGFFFALSPKEQIAVHDFGEEHAHLADSIYEKMNPLILAALPRGKPAIVYRAPTKCVPGSLIRVLKRVSAKYGPITVNSTFRSKGKNRRIGGRGKSLHLSCRAVDFRVHGSSRGLMRFLIAQREVGGFNRYPSGFYHIDNGPRRTW
jgi:uncharacterized protein YcbK (DUF882 family)